MTVEDNGTDVMSACDKRCLSDDKTTALIIKVNGLTTMHENTLCNVLINFRIATERGGTTVPQFHIYAIFPFSGVGRGSRAARENYPKV